MLFLNIILKFTVGCAIRRYLLSLVGDILDNDDEGDFYGASLPCAADLFYGMAHKNYNDSHKKTHQDSI